MDKFFAPSDVLFLFQLVHFYTAPRKVCILEEFWELTNAVVTFSFTDIKR